MIITIYDADGTKVRKPIGYAGGKCNVATQPYEDREIKGQSVKTPTDDACLIDSVSTTSRIETEN